MIRHDASPKSQAARDLYDAATRAGQPARATRRTGYRHDSPRHEDARALVPAARRSEIASMGGQARAAMYGHTPGLTRDQAERIGAAIRASHPTSGALNPNGPAQSSGDATPPAARAPGRTPAQVRADAAARAAASRPARRKAARERAAKERQP